MAKFATFVLGLLTGILTTYLFLTRVWWPDVRFPGVVQTMQPTVATPIPEPPMPVAQPSLIPDPTPEGTPALPEALASPPFAQAIPSILAGELPAAAPQVLANTEPPFLTSDVDKLRARALLIPVQGIEGKKLHDDFNDVRAGKHHEAIDILAPRGTPVFATDDGKIEKLFTSKPGGLTVYQFDPQSEYCYYYAHLDGYAPGIEAGKKVKRGDVLGYVGTTGNAPPNTPHLHFSIFRLGPKKKWWEGTAINAYPLWGAPPPK